MRSTVCPELPVIVTFHCAPNSVLMPAAPSADVDSTRLTTAPTPGVFCSSTTGATVSTVMTRVPCADTLPAASVAVTFSVSAPSPISAKSAGVSV